MDIFDALEEGMAFRPHAMGRPHPTLASDTRLLMIYEMESASRLPRVYVLYEILEEERVVLLWAVRLD